MQKRLPNNKKTREYLASLRKVYFVGTWAKWGYREHYFAYDFTTLHDRFQPMVWDYEDGNGTDDAYYLKPIELTTTGYMYTWTFDEHLAQDIVRYKQAEMEAENIKKFTDSIEIKPYNELSEKIIGK